VREIEKERGRERDCERERERFRLALIIERNVDVKKKPPFVSNNVNVAVAADIVVVVAFLKAIKRS